MEFSPSECVWFESYDELAAEYAVQLDAPDEHGRGAFLLRRLLLVMADWVRRPHAAASPNAPASASVERG